MDRQIYEQTDPKWRIAQNEFKSEIEQITRYRLVPIPMKYRADYMVFVGSQAKALFELKCYSSTSVQYPEIWISADKIMFCLMFGQFLRLPFYLWAKWTDRIGYMLITDDTPYTIGMMTNGTRNDPADHEPCCQFSKSEMKYL